MRDLWKLLGLQAPCSPGIEIHLVTVSAKEIDVCSGMVGHELHQNQHNTSLYYIFSQL